MTLVGVLWLAVTIFCGLAALRLFIVTVISLLAAIGAFIANENEASMIILVPAVCYGTLCVVFVWISYYGFTLISAM